MKKQDKEQDKWILYRNGEVRKVFENRKEAVKYYKDMLKQALKDIGEQDKTEEYDYPIDVLNTEIRPLKEREAYLGL